MREPGVLTSSSRTCGVLYARLPRGALQQGGRRAASGHASSAAERESRHLHDRGNLGAACKLLVRLQRLPEQARRQSQHSRENGGEMVLREHSETRRGLLGRILGSAYEVSSPRRVAKLLTSGWPPFASRKGMGPLLRSPFEYFYSNANPQIPIDLE